MERKVYFGYVVSYVTNNGEFNQSFVFVNKTNALNHLKTLRNLGYEVWINKFPRSITFI